MDFQPTRVVAFTRAGNPIRTPPNMWKVSYKPRTGIIDFKYRGNIMRYRLSANTRYYDDEAAGQRTSISKTAGRMALSAVASRSILGGSALGGALLDLRVSGTAKQAMAQGHIIFDDMTAAMFRCSVKELRTLRRWIPEAATMDRVATRTEKLLDLVERIQRDGPAVIVELDETLGSLNSEIQAENQAIRDGSTFHERDVARQRLDLQREKTEDITVLRNVAAYYFDRKSTNAVTATPRRSFLATAFLSIITAAACGFFALLLSGFLHFGGGAALLALLAGLLLGPTLVIRYRRR